MIMLQNFIVSNFLKTMNKIQYGSLTIYSPDNKKYEFYGSDDMHAVVHIRNWNVITNLAAKGDVGFAESYRDGDFDADSLENLCTIALKNAQMLDKYLYGGSVASLVSQVMYHLRSNTVKGSKKNIHAHYDIGNDFYSLWLDPTMTYSAAIFSDENEDLVQAQHNKYDRIVQRLDKTSGSLLEVGCGWGGFADRALEKNNFDVKGITISEEQYRYAKNRLDDKADIVLEDYRKQTGKYDNIVSIEMFEAVGEKFWPLYFGKIGGLLKDKGRAVIQTITIDNKYFDRYRKTGDAVRTFIFPGGMLPSVERFEQQAQKANESYRYI